MGGVSVKGRVVDGLVLTGLMGFAASAGGAERSGMTAGARWLPVRSLATDFQPGQLPTRAQQTVLGRLKLDSIARVSSTRIRGKTVTGDLLVIKGEYQNLTTERSYWTEGYAFVFGTRPTLCKLATCGPLPAGGWWLMTHQFGTPIIDYPLNNTVPAHSTVSFREAIPMPQPSVSRGTTNTPSNSSTTTTITTTTTSTSTTTAGAAQANQAIHSLADIWLLPIYAAFNYYEQPFPHSQLIRLSSYFGRTAIPTA